MLRGKTFFSFFRSSTALGLETQLKTKVVGKVGVSEPGEGGGQRGRIPRFWQISSPYSNREDGLCLPHYFPPPNCVLKYGFMQTFSRNQDVTVRLKSELIFITF